MDGNDIKWDMIMEKLTESGEKETAEDKEFFDKCAVLSKIYFLLYIVKNSWLCKRIRKF